MGIRRSLAVADLALSIKTVVEESGLIDFLICTCSQIIDRPIIDQQDFQANDYDAMVYCLTHEIMWILTNILSSEDEES